MDKDHNRADSTFLGAPDAVEACAMAVTLLSLSRGVATRSTLRAC